VSPSDPNQGGGVELVPQSSNQKSTREESSDDVGWEDVPEFEPVTGETDLSLPPLLVGLEPSVVTLEPGQETLLQIVVKGGSGSYRLPLGLSFDPGRLWIEGVQPGPGVEILRDDFNPVDGWMDLDLVVVDAIESGQAVAALQLRAVESGPAPLVFTATGAVTSDGSVLPVAASDGALFVNGFGKVRENQ
jgi:hypothetical protein